MYGAEDYAGEENERKQAKKKYIKKQKKRGVQHEDFPRGHPS